jgi:WD40 repeat protein
MQTLQEAPQPVFQFDSQACSACWSPDGKRIAVGMESGQIHLIDVPAGTMRQSLETSSSVAALAFSPDGKRLASSGPQHTVEIWMLPRARCEHRYFGHQNGLSRDVTQRVTALAWAPDGQRLASGSSDGSIHIWDRQGHHEATLTHSTRDIEPVGALLWHADTGLISASRGPRARLCLWHGTQRTVLEAQAAVRTLASAPYASCMAVGMEDGTIQLWDMQTGARTPRPLTRGEGTLLSLACFGSQLCALLLTCEHAIVRQAVEVGA